jgi:hypothetical protein
MKNLEIAPTKKRFVFIDILRACAVLLMILTHVVALTFDHSNAPWLQTVSLLGGTLCFTMFLFLLGVSNSISYISEDLEPEEESRKKHKLLWRVFQIAILYYTVAFFVTLVNTNMLANLNNNQKIYELLRVFYLQNIPQFSEFMIALALFLFSTIFFRGLYRKIISSIWLVSVVSLAMYFIGFLLSYVNVQDSRIEVWKSLIVGGQNMNTFPIFQYTPVLIIGLYIGNLLIRKQLIINRFRKYALISSGLFGIYVISALVYIFYRPLSLFEIRLVEGRFPPSIAFIAFGLAICIAIFTIGQFISKRASLNYLVITKVFSFISKHSLTYVLWHIVLLYTYKFVYESINSQQLQTSSAAIVIVLNLVILFVSTFIIYITNFINQRIFASKSTYTKFLLGKVVVILFALLGIALMIFRNIDLFHSSDLSVSASTERILDVQSQSNWWNQEYSSRQSILIDKSNFLQAQVIVYLEINHADLVNTKKSFFVDGTDMRIIKNNNQASNEIPSLIQDSNTDKTKIFFTVNTNEIADYSLYFGNEYASERIAPTENLDLSAAVLVPVGDVESHPIELRINKKWHLLGYNDPKDFQLQILLDSAEPLSMVEFVVFNNDRTIGTFNNVVSSADTIYAIPIEGLAPGIYNIKAQSIIVTDSIEKLESKTYRFFISYPVFINWSLDWEGFAVNQIDLDDISDIAKKYQIPITHYFNPRIYVKDQFDNYPISADLARYYTNWVINRRSQLGEEIGLHIHMYPDLLKELEIEEKPNAALIGIGRNETRIDSYTVAELDTVFSWSIERFLENGLGVPRSFRSGAWMSGPNVLQSLENNGFWYDSSGRTAGLLNPSIASSNQIPWNLSITTKPYKPNVSDINSAQSPTFNLWQFPNNGADSFWFSQMELINRFNANFSEINEGPQVVTYLSHPHSFKAYDSEKIRGLFDYLQQHSINNDKGPVVYTTLENVYLNYNLDLFRK